MPEPMKAPMEPPPTDRSTVPQSREARPVRPSLEELQAVLMSAFPEASIDIQDDSHLHAGHAGSSGGAGHYTVRLVSPVFAGMRPVARHRLVYDPVRPWMPHRVHALVIHALTPEEAQLPTRNRP